MSVELMCTDALFLIVLKKQEEDYAATGKSSRYQDMTGSLSTILPTAKAVVLRLTLVLLKLVALSCSLASGQIPRRTSLGDSRKNCPGWRI